MKRIILISALVWSICATYAQQVPLFSQYMFNDFLINPAVAGTYNYYQIRSSHRFQWMDMPDAPVTNFISAYGPHPSKNMGFGGYVFNDVTGPTSMTGASGAYAYNLAVSQEIRLSMGLSLGLKQYKIDFTKLEFRDKDYYAQNINRKYLPDATFGLYLYAANFHVGFAASQLFNNKFHLDMNQDTLTGLNRLRSHFFLTGSYKWYINRDWTIEPSCLVKYMYASNPQLDIDVKTIYRKMVWFGLSMRTGDAFSVLIGYAHQDKFLIGYAYDISYTSLGKYTSGSHELMLGYKFNSIKNVKR
jgi:type IX secretion system PorP/SprF family membrane protein